MKQIIVLLTLVLFTGVANAQLFSSGKTSQSLKQYTPGESFPSKGYDLSQLAPYPECSNNKFPDVDTLYYMKVVKNGMKARTFYFMLLTSNDVEIILNNALNNKLRPRLERRQWISDFLQKSEIANADSKNNPCWTFHKTKAAFTNGTVKYVEPSSTIRGMGYQMLDYETAKKEFYQQRGYDRNGKKISPETEFATWMLVLKTLGFITPSGKYNCNGLGFNSEAEMDDYKNAQGLK